MEYLGISFEIKNRPTLDPDFIPFGAWRKAYREKADIPIKAAVEAEDGRIVVFKDAVCDDRFQAANDLYVERLVKFLLWSVGGYRIYLCGCDRQAKFLQEAYQSGGERAFDAETMGGIYENTVEIIVSDEASFPKANSKMRPIGGHFDGCRIGFDAGGSDRKVSAVIDGETVFSEEVVWYPKLSEDPAYQYNEIISAFRTAAEKMPRVDAIGVSSAGIFVGNQLMLSSLFIKVPGERKDEVKTVYERAAKEIGDVTLAAANDGDVTALAGATAIGEGRVLGIAMGTSEAVGYVAENGSILGWLNELAFAPVDLSDHAALDEWSGDVGVGSQYFSQDAVNRLAPLTGIALTQDTSPAEKLKEVQALAEKGDERALDVFKTIGCYLAHSLVLYGEFYDIKHVIILGRVASGKGGDLIVSTCQQVLQDEYPELSERYKITLPNEKMRRVGQSMAAASLPVIE